MSEQSTSDDKERLWAALGHASCLIGLGIIGPLVLMFAGDSLVGHPSAFLKHHGKQALIFQIAGIVISMVTCGVGAIVVLVFAVIAAMAAYKGDNYVYPGLARFVDEG